MFVPFGMTGKQRGTIERPNERNERKQADAVPPPAFTFGNALSSLLSNPDACRGCFEPHVLLYTRHHVALDRVILALTHPSSTSSCDLLLSNATPSESARVSIPHVLSAGATAASRKADVTFRRSGDALLLDVHENVRSMDALPPFVKDVAAAYDVTRTARADGKMLARRRVVVVRNLHRMSPACQLAMRRVVETAARSTWLVFTSPSLAGLDPSLTSRFVCLNATPTSCSSGATTAAVSREPRVYREQGSDVFEKLVSKIAHVDSPSQLASLKLPKPSDFCEVDEFSNDAVIVSAFFLRLIAELSRVNADERNAGRNVFVGNEARFAKARASTSTCSTNTKAKLSYHVHDHTLRSLIDRLAFYETMHAAAQRLLADASSNDAIAYSAAVNSHHAHAVASRMLLLGCSAVRHHLCFCENP